MANKFRLLTEDEIECRVSTVKQDGLKLLLYKDARCDQNILDETVGPMNWQKSYTRDNANCTVSIWDDDKKMWISKEDTGTESYTEKAKGLASDSFKRACFNWGIGRELYTAPFIWINASNCKIVPKGNTFTCNDKFKVSEIGYDNKGNIKLLSIKKDGKVVFQLGNIKNLSKEENHQQNLVSDDPEEKKFNENAEKVATQAIGLIKKEALNKLLVSNDISPEFICISCGRQKLEDITEKQHSYVLNNLATLKGEYDKWRAKGH